MKIAVTIAGDGPEAAIDRRFGRAARFLILDTDTETYSLHDNSQNLDAAQGRNFTRWPILGTVFWPVPATYYTYPGEVAHLSEWLTTRTNWIDEQFRTQPRAPAQ